MMSILLAATLLAGDAVWVKADPAETNRTVSFRTSFAWTGDAVPTLEIAAASVYRVRLNGEFVGWGPARTTYGYARKDRWPLHPRAGRNSLVVDVAGYNLESYQYSGDRPFLFAEVRAPDGLLAATPRDFEAVDVPRRSDTPVYSRQRGFASEQYAVDRDWVSWCSGGASARPRLELVDAATPHWLEREVPYPDFAINADFVETADAQGRAMWRLGTLDSGFVGLHIRCVKPGRIAFEFDEALGTNGVIDLRRNGDPLKSWHACYNRLVWDVKEPGEYTLETMEPYTVRYARLATEGGEFDTARPYLRQCRNPHVVKASFTSSDPDLDALFAAAKESLAQNAVDLPTDCPSRERVGWLCDTFFSSETAAWLTGDSSIEREFLLNFTRTDDFGAKIPKGAVPAFMPSRRGDLMPTYMTWFVLQCLAAADRMDEAAKADFLNRVGTRIEGVFGWLGRFEREGLLEDLPGWVFIEWSKANSYVKGVNFPANMLWALALDRAGRAMGRPEWVAKAAAVRAKVLALAYDGTCFHDQALRSADGRLVLNAKSKTETCQYYAFFTELVTPRTHPALWQLAVEELGPHRRGHADMEPSDAIIGYLLRLNVLARYGRGRELLADMKAYYGHMAADTGTLWEFNDGHDSRCHAICAYAAVLMTKAVFGIERLDWGKREVVLGRPAAGLTADCALPVAGGVLRLSVRDGDSRARIALPPGWRENGVEAAEQAAFERFCDLAVDLPPEIRTADIAAYSTNNLTFALNNGLGRTAKGRLWASWIAGGDSCQSFTVASYSDDDGDTWSDVALVIDGHGAKPTGDNLCGRTNIIGTFWLDPTGRFRLYTDQSMLHFDGRAGIWESVCDDPDASVTRWSVPRRLGHGHMLNKPIVLRNGHWAMSGYLNDTWDGLTASRRGAFASLDAERGATCYVSTDRGASWQKRGTVSVPGNRDWHEAQLLELKDGTLRVFLRVKVGVGKLLVADSHDEGQTWTEPFALASMDNPNSRFQVRRLPSGRVLFLSHGRPEHGGKDGQGRDHLTAYLSDDDGETWQGGLELFAAHASYPDCCLGPDGQICVTHDHDREGAAEIWFHRFTEADVLAGHVVSPKGRLGILVSRGMASPHNRKCGK